MQQAKESSALATTLVATTLAVAASAATFFLPVASTTNPTAVHWRAFASTLLAFLFLGAGIIFLRSLKSFKPNVRASFRFLAYGLMAFAITLIQFIFWGIFDLWTSDWAASGSGLLPIAVACVLIYLGARKLAKLLSVKSIMNSVWFVVGVSLATFALFYVLAMFFVQYQLEGTELYIGVCALGSAFIFFAAMLVLKISKSIGSYYTKAMRWLAIGLFSLFVETSHEGINTFWFNNGDAYTDYGYYLIPFVIAGFLLMRAAYEFRLLPIKAIAAGDVDPEEAKKATDEDYVDSVVAVGGLASRPQDVESILEGLREATANLGPNSGLSADNKAKIVKTFFSLEEYLLKNDSLRSYTKEQVRGYVTPRFRAVIETAKS